MILEHERQRIVDFVVSEKRRLFPQLRHLEQQRESSRDYISLVVKLFDLLDKHLPGRLQQIVQKLGPVRVSLASQRLTDLYVNLQAAIFFVSRVAAVQAEIPRELEQMARWFFRKLSSIGPVPRHIFFIDDGLATLDFRNLLAFLFLPQVTPPRPLFPELTDAFIDDPFFFISVPAPTFRATHSIDWPLVFHECVHAMQPRVAVIGDLFPGQPMDKATLVSNAKAGDATACEIMWTEELACDFVATYTTGPGFAWRFMKGYFSLVAVTQHAYSHPPVNLRMKRVIELLRANGFTREATEAEALLIKLLSELESTAADVQAPAQADSAASWYESKLQAFTHAQFTALLAERFQAADVTSLLDDVKRKRPIVCDPAVLFTLTSFDVGCEGNNIPPLLADFIRLYCIEETFRRDLLEG